MTGDDASTARARAGRLAALIGKEARQIVRDPSSILIAFVFPMILLFRTARCPPNAPARPCRPSRSGRRVARAVACADQA